MNNEIKVSVVMITYNHERFIRQALDSILNQNVNFAYEVIIGEDCSTDSTLNIVQEYAEKYPEKIKPLIREKNLGMLKNLIDVYKHTKGKYVAFLEGDDFWTSRDKLQKQVDFLDNNLAYCAVAHQCNVIDQKGNITQDQLPINSISNGDFIPKNVERNENPGQTATLMIRRIDETTDNIIKQFKTALLPPDRVLPLYLLSKGKIYVMGDIMSSYRYYIEENGTNWSSSHDLSHKKNYFLYYFYARRIEKLGKKYGFQIDMIHYKAELFYNAFRCAKHEKVRKCYNQCFWMFVFEMKKKRFYEEVLLCKNKGE